MTEMDLILHLLNGDKDVITYRKKFNKLFGRVTTSILLQQILFRWMGNDRKPFYKFKEPCDHRLYRKNDSWVEETGFTRKEFDTSIDDIGQKLTSGCVKDDDAVVWYWTDHDRVTWYELNPKSFVNIVKLSLNDSLRQIPKGNFAKVRNVLYQNPEEDFSKREFEYLYKLIKENTTENTTDTSPAEVSPTGDSLTIVREENHSSPLAIATFSEDGDLESVEVLEPEEQLSLLQDVKEESAVDSCSGFQVNDATESPKVLLTTNQVRDIYIEARGYPLNFKTEKKQLKHAKLIAESGYTEEQVRFACGVVVTPLWRQTGHDLLTVSKYLPEAQQDINAGVTIDLMEEAYYSKLEEKKGEDYVPNYVNLVKGAKGRVNRARAIIQSTPSRYATPAPADVDFYAQSTPSQANQTDRTNYAGNPSDQPVRGSAPQEEDRYARMLKEREAREMAAYGQSGL